jgi:hypothetical protein
MKKDEVPQDKRIIKGEDNSIKKVIYVTREDGSYDSATSIGWEAENLVLSQAWDEVDAKIADTLQRVEAGELSPIAYFMEKNLMDINILAGYVGKWKWTVKRHLKASNFKNLSDSDLALYATVFNITPETLKQFPKI